jgi:hypothetical protein
MNQLLSVALVILEGDDGRLLTGGRACLEAPLFFPGEKDTNPCLQGAYV